MPISWQGTLTQYAGRLHRDYSGKQEVLIYDYVDLNIPMLERMYHKRLAGYATIGYSIRGEITDSAKNNTVENRIFAPEDYLSFFTKDVRQAKRNIFISSPYLHIGQAKKFLSWVPKRVKVQIVVPDETHFKTETEQKLKTVIKLLEKHKVQVQRTHGRCQCCAIFDKQLLWYGDINFLGYECNSNGSMRLLSAKLAEELLTMLDK